MAEDTPIDPTTSSTPSRPRHGNESEKSDIEQTPSSLPKLDDAPPDGGYGWVCVACCFFINGKGESIYRVASAKDSTIWPSLSNLGEMGEPVQEIWDLAPSRNHYRGTYLEVHLPQ
jgi:hypothetical protein